MASSRNLSRSAVKGLSLTNTHTHTQKNKTHTHSHTHCTYSHLMAASPTIESVFWDRRSEKGTKGGGRDKKDIFLELALFDVSLPCCP